MALRLAILKRTGEDSGSVLGLRRRFHASALPPPLDAPITPPTTSQPLVLPESDRIPENSDIGFGFESFSFGGSMELMVQKNRGLWSELSCRTSSVAVVIVEILVNKMAHPIKHVFQRDK
ncbi:hypothetical protein COLO4_27990 [Corchorus olitorius]|uniref:Uncharacterized protein n=1 Tax=Corchorus olitorius TaxID=93759 RepID=A0A1R3HNH8_9ROSI|nr:hypothetical protein COLO4_27990 [Corchorus olitorius]